MSKHKHRHLLISAPESTPGVAPANAAAWAAIAPTLITKHDISGIKGTYIDDPALEQIGQAVNTRMKLEGARNCEFKFSTSLFGLGVSPDDGDPAVATQATELWRKGLGGGHLSNSTTCTGGSATAPVLDDVTNVVAGMAIWFKDVTSPIAAHAGRVWVAQVKSVDVGTKVVELTEALPFTPADGDLVCGSFTGYIKETTLESAIAAQATMSHFIQLHPTDPTLTWQVMGGMHTLAISGLEKNQAPQVDVSVSGANYLHTDADGLACVTPTLEPFGYPPLAVHSGIASIADSSSTVAGRTSVSSFAAEFGVMSNESVETITEATHLFQGRHDYIVKFDSTGIKIVIPTMTAFWYTGLKAGTTFRVLYQQGSKGEGKAWAILYPKCQLIETPMKSEIGEAMGVELTFLAMPNDTVPESDNEALRISKALITMA